MGNRDYKKEKDGFSNIYHIYNRGNNKEKIFYDEQDKRAFLFRLGLVLGFDEDDLNQCEITKSQKSRIRITGKKGLFKLHAFCLMPNHFHLIVEQTSDLSISNMILRVCTSFVKYINAKYERVGHLFQDQFKSVTLESNSQLMLLTSYIHMNPVKDGLVSSPEEYIWSSFIDIVGKRNIPIINKDFLLELFGNETSFTKEVKSLYLSKVPFDTI